MAEDGENIAEQVVCLIAGYLNAEMSLSGGRPTAVIRFEDGGQITSFVD